MGTPEFAVPTLEVIAAGPDELVGVVTQPDRPAGRRRQLTPSPVKRAAERMGLVVSQPDRLLDEGVFEALAETRPDVCVVIAYGKILRPHFLELPAHGCLNVHASLLPRWRGAAPVNWAIIAGDRLTGVAVQRMEAGLDTGPVVRSWQTPIHPSETAGELLTRLAPAGAAVVGEVLTDLRHDGRLASTPQDNELATVARKLSKADGRITFDRPARRLVDRIHGLTPWPGAVCETPAGRLKLLRAEVATEDGAGGAPGEVLEASAGEGLVLATAAGSIRVLECQPPGKRRMTAGDFLRGQRDDLVGQRWGSADA